jgi:hypothetical protein
LRLSPNENDFVSPDQPRYFALRVCPRALTSPWWPAARLAFAGAPPAIRSILAGRRRVELSAAEASHALEWARALDGWDAQPLAPLHVYPLEPSAEAG